MDAITTIVITIIVGSLILAGIMGMSVIALVAYGISRAFRGVAKLVSGRGERRHLEGRQPRGMGPAGTEQGEDVAAQRPAGRQAAPASARPAQAPRPAQAARPAQTTRPAQPHRDYEHLDVDDGATSSTIARVISPYESDRVVGFYAHETIVVLGMYDRRRQSLSSRIDREFSDSAISWDHFMTTARAAFDAILRNCALLANRIQTFDVEDYERMERFYRTGGEMRNGKQDPARLERWNLLLRTKKEMDEIRSANEGLLLELDKLAAELDKLSGDDVGDDSAHIAQEVSRLVEETKYYR